MTLTEQHSQAIDVARKTRLERTDMEACIGRFALAQTDGEPFTIGRTLRAKHAALVKADDAAFAEWQRLSNECTNERMKKQ